MTNALRIRVLTSCCTIVRGDKAAKASEHDCVQAMSGTIDTFSEERDKLFMNLLGKIIDLAQPSRYVFMRHNSMSKILAACVRSGRVDHLQELLSVHEWSDWFQDVRGGQQGLALALLAVACDDRSINVTHPGIQACAKVLWQNIMQMCAPVHVCEIFFSLKFKFAVIRQFLRQVAIDKDGLKPPSVLCSLFGAVFSRLMCIPGNVVRAIPPSRMLCDIFEIQARVSPWTGMVGGTQTAKTQQDAVNFAGSTLRYLAPDSLFFLHGGCHIWRPGPTSVSEEDWT
jgi:hypothetical protein